MKWRILSVLMSGFSALCLIAALVLGIGFLAVGLEGALVSTGVIGDPGTLIITQCKAAGRGATCYGVFAPDDGGAPVDHVQYQGDGAVGAAEAVRAVGPNPQDAWPAGWGGWYTWFFPLAGGVLALSLLLGWLIRWIGRRRRGGAVARIRLASRR